MTKNALKYTFSGRVPPGPAGVGANALPLTSATMRGAHFLGEVREYKERKLREKGGEKIREIGPFLHGLQHQAQFGLNLALLSLSTSNTDHYGAVKAMDFKSKANNISSQYQGKTLKGVLTNP